MASNAIQEKSKKTKPAAGILGYFQKKTSPSGIENIPSVESVGNGEGSGGTKIEETSPGIDKENKSTKKLPKSFELLKYTYVTTKYNTLPAVCIFLPSSTFS